ncbi:MAG TPA: N,N-dimethylformamidase beta subunit family domain-containing protein, partial [Micromonosporaceae bacterium]
MPQWIGQSSQNRIMPENATPGTTLRLLRSAGESTETYTSIAGFASATSVNIRETIDFRVSVSEPTSYTIAIHRIGFYGGAGARLMITSGSIAGDTQPPPSVDPETGLVASAWRVGWTLTIPADWVSGLYMAEFTVEGDDQSTYTPFVVRDDTRQADICIVVPFVTFQADNQWPEKIGKSLSFGFDQNGQPASKDRAVKVSFDRPYDGGGVPAGFDAIRSTITWAEESGYDLTYASDLDVHAGRINLDRFAGVIVPGEAGYWSGEMRSAATAALAGGTSLAFMSAGTMLWHVRLEGPDDRVVVCYKTTPDPDTRHAMATIKWRMREPGPGHGEQTLLGVQYRSDVQAPQPLRVTNADHWFWSGAGVWEDDEIADLVSGGADGRDQRYGVPAGMAQTLLSASTFRRKSDGLRQIQNTSICEAPDGTLVFTAGTRQWAHRLSDAGGSPVRVATANVLDRMVAPRLRDAVVSDEPMVAPARNPIVRENRLVGSATWRVGRAGTRPNDEVTPQIQGYASATTAVAGSGIDFHVAVGGDEEFTISIYRIGNYGGTGARHLLDSPLLPGWPPESVRFDERTGRAECDWAPSWRLDVPADWPSGLHVAAFTTASGHRSLTPFVVRPAAAEAPICVVLPFLTYQAANRWPLDTVHGKSLGHGYNPETGDNAMYGHRAHEVSFDRPYTHTGVPAKAYIDMDVISWIERNGYHVEYASDVDIHGVLDPGAYAGLLFVGQSEYWSRPMRDAVIRATDSGTSVAFLGAGTSQWHARLESAADGRPDRVIACYKSDPDPGAVDETAATTRWRAAHPGPAMAEQKLVGAQLGGATAAVADLVVTNPGHWFWAGTDVRTGTVIEGLLERFVDEVNPTAGAPADGQGTVLASSPYTLAGKGT